MLAPSAGGVPVPITQMSIDELFVAATSQPKMETSAVIDSEFRLAFDNVMMRGRDPDNAVSLDAMERLQDMVFDHFLLKIASNTVKWFVFFPDRSINANMFLAGNRKLVSFDKNRIAWVEKSLKKLSLPSVSAVAVGKEKVVPSKRKPKRQESSSSSSEESSSSSSESSYKVSCHGSTLNLKRMTSLRGDLLLLLWLILEVAHQQMRCWDLMLLYLQ